MSTRPAATVTRRSNNQSAEKDAEEKESEYWQQRQKSKSEWDHACALLRSTSPRQTLWAARVVCRDLERDKEQGKSFRIGGSTCEWPYPTLLPVSLRCLLDANVTHTNGLELHSFTLRSIAACDPDLFEYLRQKLIDWTYNAIEVEDIVG